MPQPESGKYMLDSEVNNCYKDWLPHRGCTYKVVSEPVTVGIKTYNSSNDTIIPIIKDNDNSYDLNINSNSGGDS